MIEVFNAKRTRSFGCYASFRSAEDTLNRLAHDGILGDVPSVSVSAYRNNVLQREYQAVFVGGKWRMPKERKKRARLFIPFPFAGRIHLRSHCPSLFLCLCFRNYCTI